jgi:hypothetical protein
MFYECSNCDPYALSRRYKTNMGVPNGPGGTLHVFSTHQMREGFPTNLLHYALDMAYIAPSVPAETTQHFARRLYSTLQQLAVVENRSPEMRIVQKSPAIAWGWIGGICIPRVSRRIYNPLGTQVIHDIIPTNERLVAIHLVQADVCRQGRRPDTLPHRLT